jgi:hypothetical protein
MNKQEIIETRKAARAKEKEISSKIATIGIGLFLARLNPFCSLEKYNFILHNYIKEINPREGKFVGTKEELFQILDMMKWNHKNFDTIKAEIVFVLLQFPELSLHETLIAEYIKNKRG